MKSWIVNNFWIKIISLILAIIAWFYVNGELDKEKRISRKFYNSSLYKSSLSESNQMTGSAAENK
ncbi:MAG: hypothetical protein KJ902_05980 [Candidatus Omnitrophica bacterium]|nr:hypothetical protein [Candidatus Omnitrophota bacterium]MBU4458274.1 hypothetical protein [Candidatus Omnitrophota bacterium]